MRTQDSQMPISTEEWKTYSILIVDDELDILNSIKNTLRLKGFKVSTAISGEEGLELLKQSPAQVVMSDQKMPGGISGTEFLCKVKDLYPHTVTMVLSAFSEPEYLLGAMNEARAYYYLLKPCAQDELIQRVTQALKRYQSELEARRQFERLQALLIQSEKMATMATYAGGIAHNIRNMILPFQAPLDVIKMDTQEIKEADDTQKIELFAKYCDEIEEMVDNTNVAIDHINDLIESIMSVYKADKKESEFFDLLPIIQNAIRLQKLRHAFDNIQIHFEKTGFDFGIEALRGYLSSNIVELIKNAGDAISQKDGKAKGNVWVSIEELKTDDALKLIVRDDGCGMSPEVRKEIFAPLFTTKADLGTGLGLSAVYQMIQLHRGTIEVESEPGTGTAFIITLPKHQDNKIVFDPNVSKQL